MLRQNWPVRYSVILTNEGNINGEFNGDTRLDWVLLLFPSTQYPTEDVNNLLAGSGLSTLRWCHSGSAHRSGGDLGGKSDERPNVP